MDDSAAREERALNLRTLEAQITELAGHLNAGEHRFLTLIAEFDRRCGWSDSATQSCAHWLNWKCGIDLGAAREKVRVAHALEKLPRISAAMARGELSYSKVRALTRVACEGTEEYLLSIAMHGTAQHVETLVRQYRRAQEAEELSREARQHANRGLSYFYDDDGSLVLKGRLPAEVGVLLLKAIEAAVQSKPRPDVSAETSELPPTLAARRADALAVVAESFLAHGEEVLSGGDRHQIVVHVEAQTLREECTGSCELEDGPAIPTETARRLACDASVIRILEDSQGQPLDVGRKTRTIPPAIRRALKARDRGCRFPGCSNARYVDGHHIHHWAKGGETKLDNLVSLCRFHHRSVHEGGVCVQVLDDGALRFTKPNGESFDCLARGHTQPLSDWCELIATHRAEHIRIDADTAATRWRGERIDYGLGIEVLLQQAKHASTRAPDVSAET
jgi:Domain of unknown function (DUF222)/HNH endonuclease